MKKKDTPELFELLKKEQIDFSKTKKEESEKGKEEFSGEIKPAATIPLLTAKSTFGAREKVLPKFKTSFTQKTAAIGENVIRLSYNMAILIMLVVLIALVVSFMLGMHLGEKEGVKTRLPDSRIQEPPPHPSPISPATSGTQWAVRLTWFEDNPREENYVNMRLNTLKRDYPNDRFFTGKETLQGKRQLCIYAGPFISKNEAEKNLIKWRRQRAYQGADLKELKP